MQIKNMFEKKIDRDIKGVIKVGQSDEENVYQELDEYVVTKELLKHFRDFFNNYEKGVDGYTDKMGVWISGFFGSGKSHFLKILSYLLKNSTVEGKRAIEYFTDGKKIEDPMLIAEMTKAGTIESDVMLFNIDSKGSAKVGSGKEAIVEVFMKVFNEMQGYCGSIPYLAEFERQLDNEGRFEEFKEKFEANAGAPWEKKRQAFAVIQDKVVKTLVEMNFMSEEAARNWCKNAKGNYDLSIEKFVSLVQEYCAKKGPNHHVIFLVDEIGQYIADDTQLMLNLQTIVEDLGTACKGKAWVIVTSQEDIDSITKTKGNDFSKIQGRFDTRLSLSASNVDEVIRKRVLAKNETFFCKATISAKEPATRINEALGKLVAMKYNKLTYMETAPELSDISAIFKHSDGQMSFLGTSDTTPNKLALEEVVQVIGLNNARHMKTSLKSLQDKFGAAPYGFDPKDVQWLVAMLFKLGRVSLTLNSQSLSLLSTNPDELVRYITKREYVEKLLVDIRERATDGQIRSAKEVMKDYFGFTVSSDDDDKIMSSFKNRAKDIVKVYDDILVEYRINPQYPCKRLMEEARKRLAEILDINEPTEFFKTVDKKKDDLLDDAEDTAPVFDFFKGDQRKIFEAAVKNLVYFGNSKTYVSDQELLKVVEEIETIVEDSKPFGKIQRLPELNKRFEDLHMGLLEKEAAIMDPLVHDDFLKVKEVLDTKPFAEVLRPRINQRFEEIWDKLKKSNDIAAIKNIKLESDTLKIKCLDEIDEYERAHQPAPEPPVAPVVPGKEPVSPTPAPTKVKTKRRKNVSISNVAGARTYSIETEQDIDKFLSEMKQKLMDELEEDTIITLS